MRSRSGSRAQVSGSRAQAKPFRAQGSSSRAQGKPFRAQGSSSHAQGKLFRAQASQSRVQAVQFHPQANRVSTSYSPNPSSLHNRSPIVLQLKNTIQCDDMGIRILFSGEGVRKYRGADHAVDGPISAIAK